MRPTHMNSVAQNHGIDAAVGLVLLRFRIRRWYMLDLSDII